MSVAESITTDENSPILGLRMRRLPMCVHILVALLDCEGAQFTVGRLESELTALFTLVKPTGAAASRIKHVCLCAIDYLLDGIFSENNTAAAVEVEEKMTLISRLTRIHQELPKAFWISLERHLERLNEETERKGLPSSSEEKINLAHRFIEFAIRDVFLHLSSTVRKRIA